MRGRTSGGKVSGYTIRRARHSVLSVHAIKLYVHPPKAREVSWSKMSVE